MSKKQNTKSDAAKAAPKKTRKRYELNRRLPMIVHTNKLSDNLDLEHKVTGKDYTVIMNQRLDESYERDPVKLTKD